MIGILFDSPARVQRPLGKARIMTRRRLTARGEMRSNPDN